METFKGLIQLKCFLGLATPRDPGKIPVSELQRQHGSISPLMKTPGRQQDTRELIVQEDQSLGSGHPGGSTDHTVGDAPHIVTITLHQTVAGRRQAWVES